MAEFFRKVLGCSARSPDKIAIIDPIGRKVKYSELVELVESRIRLLGEILKPGVSRVALCMQEGLEVPVTVLALNALQTTVIPLNPKLKPNQIARLIVSVDADSVVCDSSTVAMFDDPELKDNSRVVNIDLLDEICNEDSGGVLFHVKGSYDQFLITLSSGSTGKPKPIIFSEKNKLERSNQAIQLYDASEDDIVLCASPFFHSLGQRLTLLPLILGATLVQLDNFSVQKWIDAVSRYKVTFTIPVSTHLHLVVGRLIESPVQFNSLRCLVSSSASIDKSVKHKLFDSLGCEFHEMYGASEVATATSLNRAQALEKPDSVGYPCPTVNVRIVNEKMVNCSPGEIGKILVKSPLSTSGYYKLDNLTDKAFVDDYFITGDLGFVDKEGFLYFVDREKDVIISGGANIYPSDIEYYINKVDSVDTSVVVGVDDPYLGEAVVAVIQTTGVESIIEADIRSLLRKKISSSQQPIKYFFKSSLPVSASGKVDRKEIKKELDSYKLDLTSHLRNVKKHQDKSVL